ncbi:hypothetical protein [Sphingomonas endolithica]|uniref:hypothetical protein n=1 Tax=Sphingomonas endolithica TaxID=2972485 RepID=UPI0021AF8F97|nr:hypothetical protein [Sphingomonas sp. ZFBP2030]
MATQFADITPRLFPIAPAPKLNVRIAYIAGPSVAAVAAATAQLPQETQGATLDDLAQAPGGELLAWDKACEALEDAIQARDEFNENVLTPLDGMLKSVADAGHDTSALNAYYRQQYAKFDELVGAVSAATDALALTPAFTAIGLAYKIRALAADEFHLNTADNTPLVEAIDADARALLDTAIEHNPWMRGPLIRWQKGYARYQEALRKAQTYYAEVLTPADAAFNLVRDKWPTRYDFSRDPAARKELDDVSYDEIEAISDANWRECYDARLELYRCPAPSATELGVKMKLFVENDDHDLGRAGEVAQHMMHDARRFGRLGSHPIGDEALNKAFAGLRREMIDYQTRPAVEDPRIEDDKADARVDALEKVIYDARCKTIEGVVAKLRIGFQHAVESSYGDLALLNPSSPEFVEGLRMGDMSHQMLWAAIEDLARIAGLNLAEQGA